MTLHEATIKQLRADARRASLVAKHLREYANLLAREARATEKAERARVNFFSKPAKIDPEIPLTPIFKEAEERRRVKEDNHG